MEQNLKEAIFRVIDKKEKEIIQATADILKFKTVSGSKSPEEKKAFEQEKQQCLKFIKELAAKLGFHTFRSYDDVVAVIEQSGEQGCIGVPLHLDVVPPGDGWQYPPFAGEIAEGYIWGRGVQDNKGPVIASLYGLWAVKQVSAGFKRTMKLILATQEETGDWSDVRLFKDKEGEPEFCFVPDAEFPIINGEKGMVNVKIRGQWPEVKASDSQLVIESLKGGERANVVPEKASIGISCKNVDAVNLVKSALQKYQQDDAAIKYELKQNDTKLDLLFLGKRAHGSRPFDGRNAIVDALGLLSYLGPAESAQFKFARFIYEACADIYGGVLKLKSEHHFVGPTTINLGIFNMDRQNGEAIINVRNTLGQSVAQVNDKVDKVVTQAAKETGVNMVYEKASSGTEPLYVNPETNKFYLDALMAAYKAATGQEPRLSAIGGTTFAKAFSRAVCYGPVVPEVERDIAHSVNERFKVESQIRNTRIYALAIFLLAAR